MIEKILLILSMIVVGLMAWQVGHNNGTQADTIAQLRSQNRKLVRVVRVQYRHTN